LIYAALPVKREEWEGGGSTGERAVFRQDIDKYSIRIQGYKDE